MYEMQADILCTVPQHIGYFPEGKTTFQTISEIVDKSMLPKIKMSAGQFLVWPLWIAGMLDIATDEVREFVIRNLNSVGRTMGIKHAHGLADVLQAKARIILGK